MRSARHSSANNAETDEDDARVSFETEGDARLGLLPFIRVGGDRLFVGIELHKTPYFRDFVKEKQITHIVDLTHCLEPSNSSVCHCAFYDLDCYHTNDVRYVTPSIAIAQTSDIYEDIGNKAVRHSDMRVLIVDDTEDMTYAFALAWALVKYIDKRSTKDIARAVRKMSSQIGIDAHSVLKYMHNISRRPGDAPPLVTLPPLSCATPLHSL